MKRARLLTATLLSTSLMLVACGESEPEPTGTPMTMSFTGLMAMGENHTCTFSDEESGVETSGTVYIQGSEGNFRGDFDIAEDDGTTYNSHMIKVGNTTYMWSSQMEQGISMDLPEGDSSLFANDDAGDQMGINEDEPMEFHCESWDVDAGLFTPPTDREFMDMNGMMHQMMELRSSQGAAMPENVGGDMMKAQQCMACEQAPDATSKAQCRAALGC